MPPTPPGVVTVWGGFAHAHPDAEQSVKADMPGRLRVAWTFKDGDSKSGGVDYKDGELIRASIFV